MPRRRELRSGQARISLVAISLVLSVVSSAEAQEKLFHEQHQMLPEDRDFTHALTLGDVDGDGDADLVVGNYYVEDEQQNRLYLSDGSGIFRDVTATQLPVDTDGTHALGLGDVDGDGDLDLVLGNADPNAAGSGRQTRLYLNDGNGIFLDVTVGRMPVDADHTFALLLLDVDGDGALDIVLGNDGQNRAYVNDGAGVFVDETTTYLPPDVDNTRSLAMGDVDGDGDQDLVLGNHWGENRLYLNDGTGVFSDVTAACFPPDSSFTGALALSDMDGDGDLDVVLGNGRYSVYSDGGEQNGLYLNDGAGTFTNATATHMPVDNDATFALVLSDWDGDGDPDIVFGNSWCIDNDGQNRVYLNSGTGAFSDDTAQFFVPLEEPTRALALSDVDGDGDDDLIAGSESWTRNRMYLSDGDGALVDATATHIPTDRDDSRSLAIGDVNGDGHADLVVGIEDEGDDLGGQNRLYVSDGTGAFEDVTTTHLPEHKAQTAAVALGDVDGDGDCDLVEGNYGWTRLYLNDGSGIFSDVTATNLPPEYPELMLTSALVLGDLDGDGDLDILMGRGRSGLREPNRLYRNDGTGVFSSSEWGGHEVTNALALDDVDGDGNLDIAVGDSGTVYLRLGDGAGGFQTVYVTSDYGAKSLALGDVDGDLDIDIVVGSGFQDRLYLNDGSGSFSDATDTNMPVGSFHTQTVALGDVDGDGDADLVLGVGFGLNRLYLNDGTGNFVDATDTGLMPSGLSAQDLKLADVDEDGDLDLLLAKDGQNHLLTNLSRQLAWRAIPRIGKPLTMDLNGSPGGIWLLAWAMNSAEILLPPWGTLRLDPGTLQVADMGLLDGDGFATLSWLAPNDPALVGVSYHLQAAIGTPLRLSNREVATFTAL